jgi:hypothetical protein
MSSLGGMILESLMEKLSNLGVKLPALKRFLRLIAPRLRRGLQRLLSSREDCRSLRLGRYTATE